jgi:hypothetical protein
MMRLKRPDMTLVKVLNRNLCSGVLPQDVPEFG